MITLAIKIQTQTPVIPIEIGDLTINFEYTDENIKRLYDHHDKMQKEIEKIKSDDLESAKEILRKSFDFLLGEGTFEKIYAISPSIIIVTDYYFQIVEGLFEEISKKAGNTAQQKIEKYLQGKKKK